MTQKRTKERYSIFIDQGQGEEYGFSVDEDVLIKFKLKKGQQLSEEELNDIFYADQIKKAYHQAIQFLSYRMRSKQEIIDYLSKKEYTFDAIENVIERLTYYKYLNDEEFAKMFVRTRMNTSNKGPDVIQFELHNKGVTKSIIEIALKEYTYELQLENAKTTADKKVQQNSGRSSSVELRQKLRQYLIQKGFSWDITTEVLKKTTILDENKEQAALKKQVLKAQKKYQNYDDWESEQRMKQYLLRKGFKYEDIDEALKSINDETI